MERKEINAILSNELIEFLKRINLEQDFVQHKIFCECCKKPITTENVAIIRFDEKYMFYCDNLVCIDSSNE